MDPSVGSVGDVLDNALAETTFGSFKNELIWREGPWRDVDHVEIETLTWVGWFNIERPHEYLEAASRLRVNCTGKERECEQFWPQEAVCADSVD